MELLIACPVQNRGSDRGQPSGAPPGGRAHCDLGRYRGGIGDLSVSGGVDL